MVNITANKTGSHITVTVIGHADTHDACVMVSVLSQTLVGVVRINPNVDALYETMEPGYLKLDFITTDPMAEEDVRCIVIGLIQVQNTYPEGVSITQNIF